MKRAALILAALAAILTAAAAPVRTATETFVTNKISEAVAAIPAPDYSTNNAALVETAYSAISYFAATGTVKKAKSANTATRADMASQSDTANFAYNLYSLPDWNSWRVVDLLSEATNAANNAVGGLSNNLASVATSGKYSDLSGKPTNVSAFENDAGYLTGYTESDPTVPQWAKAPTKPTYTASEVGAYSTGDVDTILRDYLPLDYFKDGQTIPMYRGDGTKLCDFGANWLGILVNTVSEKPDDADIPPAVSNVVTTALVRERLGVYLYVGADGGIYVHTNED